MVKFDGKKGLIFCLLRLTLSIILTIALEVNKNLAEIEFNEAPKTHT